MSVARLRETVQEKTGIMAESQALLYNNVDIAMHPELSLAAHGFDGTTNRYNLSLQRDGGARHKLVELFTDKHPLPRNGSADWCMCIASLLLAIANCV